MAHRWLSAALLLATPAFAGTEVNEIYQREQQMREALGGVGTYAKVRNETLHHFSGQPVLCGEVELANGFRRFLSGGVMPEFDDGTRPAQFERDWNKLCTAN